MDNTKPYHVLKDGKFFHIQNSAVVLASTDQETTLELSFMKNTLNTTFGNKYSMKATATKTM